TVEFASAFAGLKCREVGGRAGIPTLQETMEFTEA
ncbi:MAG: ribokinase, partial [Deltaproteobacteria bacterium]|nr:ribokinase [Deltaproteobacteria bacterium]